MPLVHSIDSHREWLVTQATGPVTYEEIHQHLLVEQAQAHLGYPELIDGTTATVAFSSEEVRHIVDWLRETASTETMGPTAIVVGSDVAYGMMRMMQALLDDVISLRPFRSLSDAETWLLLEGRQRPLR